jgi:UDP-N-acetylglucosamine 2-epimerase (non-hydrolysing)
MVDTLLTNLERAKARSVVSDLELEPGGYALLTLHRPSNVDDPALLSALLATIAKVAERVPVVFPVHPRTARQLENVALDGIRLSQPFGYLDFLALQASAAVVLTDSGGIQEETTVLGIPCVTLRETTERPITVTEGTNVVVGTDPARIIEAADRALAGEVAARRPALWDGHASERIADVLLDRAGSSSKGWT